MRANKTARGQLLLGHDARSGRPYHLSLNDFRRGAFLRGAIGSGKTTLFHRFLTCFGIQHNVVQFDFSGTGAFHFQAFIAQVTSLLAVAGRRVPLLRAIETSYSVTRLRLSMTATHRCPSASTSCVRASSRRVQESHTGRSSIALFWCSR
jgi:hypothetical protein